MQLILINGVFVRQELQQSSKLSINTNWKQ